MLLCNSGLLVPKMYLVGFFFSEILSGKLNWCTLAHDVSDWFWEYLPSLFASCCSFFVQELVWNECRQLIDHCLEIECAHVQYEEWKEWDTIISVIKHIPLILNNYRRHCTLCHEGSLLEFEQLLTIWSSAFCKHNNGRICALLFNDVLSFTDVFNNLISFILSSTSCNKDTADSLT